MKHLSAQMIFHFGTQTLSDLSPMSTGNSAVFIEKIRTINLFCFFFQITLKGNVST